jgi:RNA polymerase sigma factor (sigma-70 family)
MSVEALIKDWRGKIRTMSNRVAIRGVDAEDIEQELNIVLWQAAESYDESKGRFSTYFYTCARNKIGKMKDKSNTRKRTATLIPLSDDYDIPFCVCWEDIEFIATIESSPLAEQQKKEMLEVALMGTCDNATFSVSDVEKVVGDLRYNIGRKGKKRLKAERR